MPLDHLGIYTPSDQHTTTIAFYAAFLAPLGYAQNVSMFDGQLVAFGDPSPDFWISSLAMKNPDSPDRVVTCAHFAFTAKDQKTVEECYAKGLEAGGKDNGKPGPRPHYHEGYYGAFLKDPAGNGVEVVFHGGRPSK